MLPGGGSRSSPCGRGADASATAGRGSVAGGLARRSASLASSAARRRARSESPPSATACRRQAIFVARMRLRGRRPGAGQQAADPGGQEAGDLEEALVGGKGWRVVSSHEALQGAARSGLCLSAGCWGKGAGYLSLLYPVGGRIDGAFSAAISLLLRERRGDRPQC